MCAHFLTNTLLKHCLQIIQHLVSWGVSTSYILILFRLYLQIFDRRGDLLCISPFKSFQNVNLLPLKTFLCWLGVVLWVGIVLAASFILHFQLCSKKTACFVPKEIGALSCPWVPLSSQSQLKRRNVGDL